MLFWVPSKTQWSQLLPAHQLWEGEPRPTVVKREFSPKSLGKYKEHWGALSYFDHPKILDYIQNDRKHIDSVTVCSTIWKKYLVSFLVPLGSQGFHGRPEAQQIKGQMVVDGTEHLAEWFPICGWPTDVPPPATAFFLPWVSWMLQ